MVNFLKISLALFVTFYLTISVNAQHANVFSLFVPQKKGAEREYENGNYILASKYYKVLVDRDSSNIDNVLRLATCYHQIEKTQESEYYFRMASRKRALDETELAEFVEVLYKNKRYDEAQKILKQNFSLKNIKKGAVDFQNNITTLKRDSFCYTIKKLSINSPKSDFSPTFFQDGLIFVSNREITRPLKLISNRDSSEFFDLYLSIKEKNGVFSEPVALKGKSNTLYHEGPSVFFDNYSKIIMTKSLGKPNRKDGKQTLGLFIADWDSLKNSVKDIKAFPFNSDIYSIGQPSISEDGLRLYFVSDMPGGYGGTDLYVSHLEKNQWGTPANLGAKINTEYDEMFPFVQGNIIYFSSNRPGGLGGLDIFASKLAPNPKIRNLGYPMNSNADDFGAIFEKDGLSGYFSSNRGPDGINDDNIYSFKVNEVILNVTANERLTKVPMQQVKVVYRQIAGESDTILTDSLGRAKIHLKPSYMYTLVASKSGYREISNSVSTKTFTTSGVLNAAFNFDRKYKSYVNVSVTDKGTELPISNSTVLVYNITRQNLDTVYTDEEGKNTIEVENENNYTFVVYTDNKIAIEKLSTKKIGKFTKILFVYPKMEKATISKITISTVDADSLKPMQETKVTVIDKTLNFSIDCFTNEEGKFSFIGFPKHAYQFKAKKSYRQGEVLEYKPKSINEEIQIKLKSKLE